MVPFIWTHSQTFGSGAGQRETERVRDRQRDRDRRHTKTHRERGRVCEKQTHIHNTWIKTKEKQRSLESEKVRDREAVQFSCSVVSDSL